MSISFQERFKNRISQIDKFGNIDTSESVPITKPMQRQLFEHPRTPLISIPDAYQSLRQSYIEPPKQVVSSPRSFKAAEPFPRKQAHSAKPFRQVAEERKEERLLTQLAPVSEFKPYNLRDYQAIKPDKYYELGGLGPSTVGTDEWKAKKQIVARRNEYVKLVNSGESNLPPSNLRQPAEKINKKCVSCAASKGSGLSSSPISYVLDELSKGNKAQ